MYGYFHHCSGWQRGRETLEQAMSGAIRPKKAAAFGTGRLLRALSRLVLTAPFALAGCGTTPSSVPPSPSSTPTTPAQPSPPPFHIYVADFGNNRLVALEDMTGRGWTILGGFTRPRALALDATFRIYVADTDAHRIVRVDDMAGSSRVSFGNEGVGIGQFRLPYGVALDAQGRIYAADSNNARIMRVDDMTGSGWTALGSQGTGVMRFDMPLDVFVDPRGRIYVADWGNFRVVRVDDIEGHGWVSFGLAQRPDVGAPLRVFVDRLGRLYFTDYNNLRIVRIDDMYGGGFVHTPRFTAPVEGLSVDDDFRIYATLASSSGPQLMRLDDMDGNGSVLFGPFGSGTNQFWAPRGVAVR